MYSHDAEDLYSFLDQTVDITYENTHAAYSRNQARMILNDFYTRQDPYNFEIDYIGTAAVNDAWYVIGTAHTHNGKFRVYLYIRSRSKRQVIMEMKISR